MYVREST